MFVHRIDKIPIRFSKDLDQRIQLCLCLEKLVSEKNIVTIGIVIVTIIDDDVYGNCDMCQTRDPGIEYQPVCPTPQEIPRENIKTLHSLHYP